jgi:2-polyprenyl-3-methyl-5-hydroxy-6-metoxy-1,4-benzoquinol methylase
MQKANTYYNANRPEIASLISKDIKTILDVGCGEGVFLKYIKDLTQAETWGIEMITALEGKIKENTDHYLLGKIEDLLDSLPDNYFDCITFNDVLEHMVEPSKVLELIKPKLSPQGIIVASIPNVRLLTNLKKLIVNKDWMYSDQGILDSTHLRFFTKKSMKRLFENAGYKVILQKGLNKLSSQKVKIFNILTFSFFNDAQYMQFANVAKAL